jgi:hypothetical protein
MIIHPASDLLEYCTNTRVSTAEGEVSALQVLLKTWTETFEILQGYNQIRLSIVALSRVFEYDVSGIDVKGDEITEPEVAGRIVTRSQRRNGTPPAPFPPSRQMSLLMG